jgi:quercetin dioxygenase-like cupin family protein
MPPHDWNRIEEEQMSPLVGRKVFHGKRMTVARIRLKKTAMVPMHQHENEQITMLESGALRFVFPEGEKILRAGEMLEIAPGKPHSVEALEDSVAIDLFSPVREDWIRGDDAYLRK